MADSPPETLRDLVEAFVAGGELAPAQRRAAAAALSQVQAIVLSAATLAERDALIVATCCNFFAGRSVNDASQQFAVQWRRYAASAWQRERACDACPPRRVGTLNGAFWRMMKLAPRPLKARQIRRIVGHSRWPTPPATVE
jgi:hypothetical protein